MFVLRLFCFHIYTVSCSKVTQCYVINLMFYNVFNILDDYLMNIHVCMLCTYHILCCPNPKTKTILDNLDKYLT